MSEQTTLQEAVDKALQTLQELMEKAEAYSGDDLKLKAAQAVLTYAAEREKDGGNE